MFLIRCALLALNIAYAPIRTFSRRIKGKVTLLSSQDDVPSRDIRMLAAALSAGQRDRPSVLSCGQDRRPVPLSCISNPKVVVLAGRMRRSFAGALKFAGHLLRELYHIASSEVVVLEGYTVSVGAVKHKPGVTILQMWHAPDAIKKFSRQLLDTPAGQSTELADALGMHRNYDYLLCPSPAVAPAFKEAFGVTDEQLVYLGMPRIDYLSALRQKQHSGDGSFCAEHSGDGSSCVTLTDEPRSTRAKILGKYPRLHARQGDASSAFPRPVIVYAPTFRDGRPVELNGLLKHFDFGRFTLVVKLHPLYPQEISAEWTNRDGLLFDKEFSTDEWLTTAAAVITDYSGVAVEAAAAAVPVYFYVYDIDQYMAERGLNFDLRREAVAPYVFMNGTALAGALDPAVYDLTRLRTFRERMLSCPDMGNTERLAAFVRSFLTKPQRS
ncbi:CDP-glycerol--glycerophosphate glycerophosphotransferase [Clostridia bacterium]|nr:CDP-glycerol--glycerophosphate glycerophosphotransferase [Clostridia bacterium]